MKHVCKHTQAQGEPRSKPQMPSAPATLKAPATLNIPAINISVPSAMAMPGAATIPIMIAPSPIFTLCNRHPALAMYTNRLLSWDTSLCIHINQYSTNQAIARFFKTVSRLGDGWFWYAMLLLPLLMYGMAALLPILSVILVSLTGLVIYKLLKIKTVRPRPYQVHQVIVLGERPLDVFSFPSGHTLQAVLFTATIGSYFPMLLPIMIPFALLVALSRMVLGLHYPTDVLIGASIGYGLSLWAPSLNEYLKSSSAMFLG